MEHCLLSLILFFFQDSLLFFWCWDRDLNGKGGARGVMVIVVGNGHGDTSSNPGRD